MSMKEGGVQCTDKECELKDSASSKSHDRLVPGQEPGVWTPSSILHPFQGTVLPRAGSSTPELDILALHTHFSKHYDIIYIVNKCKCMCKCTL